MEKRESKRQSTHSWEDLQARTKVGDQSLKFPVVDISIGGIGVLVNEGYSLLHVGKQILIETLEKKGMVIATDIQGRVAYLGTGVPSRVGIDISPADTPIEAYAKLSETLQDPERIITDKDTINRMFASIKEKSRGFGDMLMIHKKKAIPAEFFYLRPELDNMVLRVVRISDLQLPFQPQIGMIYPFYLFKGIDVMLFTAKIQDIVKNILETSWPDSIRYISRRSVLRYLVTGNQPVTAVLQHPLSKEKIRVFIWDISIEGMGVEILSEKTPLIEGMSIGSILLDLPGGQVRTSGIIRSVRCDSVLNKTQIGIEFMGGAEHYQDKILQFVLQEDLPSETLLKRATQTL